MITPNTFAPRFKYQDRNIPIQEIVADHVARNFGATSWRLDDRWCFDYCFTEKYPTGNKYEVKFYAEIKNRKGSDFDFSTYLLELPKALKAREYILATGFKVYICYGFGFIDNTIRRIMVHNLNPDLSYYQKAWQKVTYRQDKKYDNNVMIYIPKKSCTSIEIMGV